MSNRKSIASIAAMVSLGMIFLTVVLSIAVRVLGNTSDAPFLEEPLNSEKGCVEKTSYMRYQHMELLKSLRDRAIRQGQPNKVTFDTCQKCHADRAAFCDRCHEAASVRPDCFNCHDYSNHTDQK